MPPRGTSTHGAGSHSRDGFGEGAEARGDRHGLLLWHFRQHRRRVLVQRPPAPPALGQSHVVYVQQRKRCQVQRWVRRPRGKGSMAHQYAYYILLRRQQGGSASGKSHGRRMHVRGEGASPLTAPASECRLQGLPTRGPRPPLLHPRRPPAAAAPMSGQRAARAAHRPAPGPTDSLQQLKNEGRREEVAVGWHGGQQEGTQSQGTARRTK